jgi:hypothetical protein
MDAFEFNKIAGAVLSALLVLFAIKTVFGIANETHGTAKPGYVIAMKAPPPTKPGKAVPAGFDAKAILAKLAGASAEDDGAGTVRAGTDASRRVVALRDRLARAREPERFRRIVHPKMGAGSCPAAGTRRLQMKGSGFDPDRIPSGTAALGQGLLRPPA